MEIREVEVECGMLKFIWGKCNFTQDKQKERKI